MKSFVIAGIGTGVGKTIASAVLVEALEADYWKPVQSGALEDSDTLTVRRLVQNSTSIFHPEAFKLREPLSPHIAARMEGVEIQPEQIVLPRSANNLVIETAGGLMTPVNDSLLNIDLLTQWELPVILVSQNYLGSINHTLLSLSALAHRHIAVAGILFNGEPTPASENLILNHTGVRCLGRIPIMPRLDSEAVSETAKNFNYLKQLHVAG